MDTGLYDKIILGAGLYGLYAALFSAKKDEKVLVLEYDEEAFKRATYINQARVHMGYHYPRSLATALKSASYFDRFNRDFDFCIHRDFKQIYATSSAFSWTAENEFEEFCKNAGIPCERVAVSKYFKDSVCDGAFLTKEYTYDAHILRDYYLEKLKHYTNVKIEYGIRTEEIARQGELYELRIRSGSGQASDLKVAAAPYVLNATYASVNQLNGKAGFESFAIKYELCEIILCDVGEKLKDIGITVMDGPFFSIMPFGKTGKHSLTAVTQTPHMTSYDDTPVFPCQRGREDFCTKEQLGNCNDCPGRPKTAWGYMSQIARKYMKEEYAFSYAGSLFSMKPILRASEVDDSRPTLIRVFSEKPYFVSVLSGKINTVYDLDEYL